MGGVLKATRHGHQARIKVPPSLVFSADRQSACRICIEAYIMVYFTILRCSKLGTSVQK